jgi:hypothetical protein
VRRSGRMGDDKGWRLRVEILGSPRGAILTIKSGYLETEGLSLTRCVGWTRVWQEKL